MSKMKEAYAECEEQLLDLVSDFTFVDKELLQEYVSYESEIKNHNECGVEILARFLLYSCKTANNYADRTLKSFKEIRE